MSKGRATPAGSNGWKAPSRPATLDHLLNRKKPVYEDVPVVLDSDRARRYNKAEAALTSAQQRRDVMLRLSMPADPDNAEQAEKARLARSQLDEAQAGVDEAQAELDAAEAGMEEAVVTIRVRSRGEHVLDEMNTWLREQHPPTDRQLAEHRREWDKAMALAVSQKELTAEQAARIPYTALDIDPAAFNAALVSACAVIPEMTFEEAQSMLGSDSWTETEVFFLVEACKNVQLARPQVNLGKGSGRKPASA